MGSLCCCFRVNDHEDSSLSNSNDNEGCRCPNCRLHTLLNKYTALFKKDETLAGPSDAHQGAALSTSNSSSSSPSSCNILPEIVTSQLRTMRFDPQLLHKQLRYGDSTNYPERAEEDGRLTKLERLDLLLKSPLRKLGPEDEDVCPTCLEEYTLENPKIVTQCRHHYHLSCIYEWMERSPTCPVCSKVMVFDETT
ncbi:E3 ubiquitin-protein ligase [Citrus sinensis]|uniref:E3 ubiquitin-protein ligase At3g02290 n=1 Tax=Citrus sinensis TaxID=2711 RepID=UPI0003D743BD|nr:E3 ubiquitin-protein ligase At3g02290 [Citrus sinensis]KAH9707893.1 E3 ubiquitin-protein ligase [Citrus sinensis]